MWKLGRIVAMFRKELLLAWAVLRDPRTPNAAKLTTVLAILYVISPVDLVSDFIPILGWLDDGLIAFFLLKHRISPGCINVIIIAVALHQIPCMVSAFCRLSCHISTEHTKLFQ